MAATQAQFSQTEFQERGTAWYERLRPQVEPGNIGKIVAIDILTGAYAIGVDTVAASDRL